MAPRRYGPLAYVPITRRPKLTWPGGARVALWVNPNIEFFGLDGVMPGNLNERVSREYARIPNVLNWAVRDYGNRVGIWRIMEVLPLWHSRQRGAQQRGVRPSSGDHRGGRPARLGTDRPQPAHLTEVGIRYVCDWVNDDQPYLFEIARRAG